MDRQENHDYLTTHGIRYEAVDNMAGLDLVEHPYPDCDAKG